MDKPQLTAKKWDDRSNTLGVLPGKGDEQHFALRKIVDQLPLAEKTDVNIVSAKGQVKSVSADQLFIAQLSRGSFVRRQHGVWDATEAVRYWMESGDDLYLSFNIHCNVKFFGELLALIDNETRTADFLKGAKEYGLYWTSPDQVHRRLGWMQSLKLVERWGLSRLVVTELGKEFLKGASLTTPEDARRSGTVVDDDSAELPEPDELAAQALVKLGAAELSARKVLIGYIPRGQKSVGRPSDETQVSASEATRRFIDLLDERISSDELFRRASVEFGMKKTSFTQSMHTFRNMHMIDMVALNEFGVTNEGRKLLSSGHEIDLVRYLHSRYRFFGEALSAAQETVTVSELARRANKDFDCEQIDTSEIRTRLSFMAEAGLVHRVDWTRYVATSLGRALADELPLEAPKVLNASTDQELEPQVGVPAELGAGDDIAALGRLKSELIKCSRLNEATSTEFEKIVAQAFRALGFRADHIGGPSKTDVLVTAELPDKERYSSIVDAKASASGIIGDNAIKFDALKDHRRRHAATFGIVVGPDFSTRVKDWAHSNGFILLTADDLAGLIERQAESPLTLGELRTLFDTATSDLEAVEWLFDKRRSELSLLQNLLTVLAEEANDEDPAAGGQISLENLQYAMKTRMDPRPSREEVRTALNLLASPLVRSVEVADERYRLIDSPKNIARRLQSFGAAVTVIDA